MQARTAGALCKPTQQIRPSRREATQYRMLSAGSQRLLQLQRSHTRMPMLLALSLAFLLWGCASASTPLVAPSGPAPTPLGAPLRPLATQPRAQPATVTSAPWSTVTGRGFALSLPATWEVVSAGGPALQALYDQLEKQDPELAGLIGGADALRNVALLAYLPAQGGAPPFAANLNIRFEAMGTGAEGGDLGDVLGPILQQYRTLGLDVSSIRTDLQIGGHPAASLALHLPVHSGGGTMSLEGRQYFVLAPGGLWILTFVAGPEQMDLLASDLARVAATFSAD